MLEMPRNDMTKRIQLVDATKPCPDLPPLMKMSPDLNQLSTRTPRPDKLNRLLHHRQTPKPLQNLTILSIPPNGRLKILCGYHLPAPDRFREGNYHCRPPRKILPHRCQPSAHHQNLVVQVLFHSVTLPRVPNPGLVVHLLSQVHLNTVRLPLSLLRDNPPVLLLSQVNIARLYLFLPRKSPPVLLLSLFLPRDTPLVLLRLSQVQSNLVRLSLSRPLDHPPVLLQSQVHLNLVQIQLPLPRDHPPVLLLLY